MTRSKSEKLFDNETGSKTINLAGKFDGVRLCTEIALSLESGSISLTGTVAPDSTAADIAAIKCADFSLVESTLEEAGNYIIPAEMLYSITFTGTSASAYVTYLY